MNNESMKKAAAYAALDYMPEQGMIGIGTGSTINYFIDALASRKHLLEGTVASSQATAERLKAHGIPVFDLNVVGQLPIYVDGADEVDAYLRLIKGGGGALTREKIIATAAEQFICIADQSKQVDRLGDFPIAIEVIPIARSYVGRQLVKLAGIPKYREGFITDNGNIIIDVYQLDISDPLKMEYLLNNITGIVCHGLFAKRTADKLLLGTETGVHLIKPKI